MKKPNILYIMPDEFRQRCLGFRQEDPVLTPNLDRFARECVELENVYSNYPVCTPHRAMLFTGQYPCRSGVMGNSNSATAQFFVRLPRHTTCLPDVLAAQGYDCGYVGKWHLDSPEMDEEDYLEPRRDDGKIWDAYTSPDRRHHFRYWFSYGCNDQHFHSHYWENEASVDQVQNFPGPWSVEVEAEKVIGYLKNKEGQRPADQPFFLMWAPNPPHMPFDQVPEKYKKLYADKSPEELLNAPAFTGMQEPAPELSPADRARFEANRDQAASEVADYFACVTGVDDSIGQVLQALDDAGLKEDTLVIFASDHGDLMGSHGLLRKGPWFDDCLKIPYLIRYPGRLEAGKRTFPLNTPDIMPTLLGLLGLEEEIPATAEGINKASYIWDPELRAEGEDGLAYYINAPLNARGVRDDQYFLVVRRNMHDEEQTILYDLQEDPDQLRDVAAQNPQMVTKYRNLLQDWLVRCEDWWIR